MVKYRGNTAIMHTDTNVMPKNKIIKKIKYSHPVFSNKTQDIKSKKEK